MVILEELMDAHGRDWRQRLAIASKDLPKFIGNAYVLQKLFFQFHTFSNLIGHH